jgi:hypothetical protein
MAVTAGLAHTFLKELLQGAHAFCQDGTSGSPTNVTPARSAGASDSFYGALVYDSATFTPSTYTNYSNLGASEVANGNGYTTGGALLTVANGQAIVNSTSGVVTPSASLTWTGLTINTSFSGLAIYNSTSSGRAVSLHSFGAQTITAGTLTLTMPSNVAGSALIELAGTV